MKSSLVNQRIIRFTISSMFSVPIQVIMREQCIKQWLLTSKSLKYDITVLTMYIYCRESSLFVVSLLALMHFWFSHLDADHSLQCTRDFFHSNICVVMIFDNDNMESHLTVLSSLRNLSHILTVWWEIVTCSFYQIKSVRPHWPIFNKVYVDLMFEKALGNVVFHKNYYISWLDKTDKIKATSTLY